MRRRWPERLIAWSRLLAGNVRDPLVGRDLLIGIAAGLAHVTLASSGNWLPAHLGLALPLAPHATNLDALLGVRYALSSVSSAIGTGIIFGLGLIVTLVGLNIVLRRRSFAAVGLFVLQVAVYAVAAGGNYYILATSVMISALWTVVIARVGLLGIATANAIFLMAFQLPISIDFSSWMIAPAVTPLIFIALLTAFAFHTALGGQPMFSARILDE